MQTNFSYSSQPQNYGEKKIPLVFHQIWWQGPENLPSKYDDFQKSWKIYHPNAKFCLWSKDNIELLVQSCFPTFFSNVFSKYPKMIQKIDVAKICILIVFGGIYVDMDMECVANIEHLVQPHYDLILSKANLTPVIKNALNLAGLYNVAKYQINNAFIGSSPENPLLKKFLNVLAKNQHLDKKSLVTTLSSSAIVMKTTGPEIFSTFMVSQLKKLSDPNFFYKIYPSFVFEHPNQDSKLKLKQSNLEISKSLNKNKDTNVYAIHHSEGTWSPFSILLYKIKKKLQK